MTRDDALADFAARMGWQEATWVTVAGDASNRRYMRLTRPEGETAILMDAPPDRGEDVRPFIRIAEYLCAQGLSAPRILHRDTEAGMLLIEDLGDDLFARVLTEQPALENSLYSAATDVLLSLHERPAPADLAPYDVGLMADMAALAHDWYATGLGRENAEARTRLHSAMGDALTPLDGLDAVLIQRDYHAENLLWMPQRDGLARVGLLDFQDAMRGHRAYDLVSLLQDARRDVPEATEAAMIARYLDGWGGDATAFTAAYRALGAQRNLRIIGVFARLCLRDGKSHYLDFLPRVWTYLMRDLAAPELAALRAAVTDLLPPPDSGAIDRLRAQCSSM